MLGTSDSAGTDEKIRFQVISETVSQFARSRLAASAQCIDAEFEMSGNGVGANNIVAVPRPLGAIAAEMPCLAI